MISDDELRFRLTVHYDGSGFQGWQLQPQGRTVQGEIEAAVDRLTGARRPVVGAGRTDTGVHAAGQVAAVTLPSGWTALELRRALNAVLPADLWIAEAHEAPKAFHPRYDAISRSYFYRLGLAPEAFSPFWCRWCWPFERELDLELLKSAAALLEGERSFRSFAKAGQEQRGYRCVVAHAGWDDWDDLGVVFSITANRFLHHMVRYLVGTMVDVALARRPLGDVEGLLDGSEGRLTTSPPAPPQGLFLSEVGFRPGSIVEPGSGEEQGLDPHGR